MIDIDLLLSYGAAYKKISAGETIFTEGQACFFYYQLISGKVLWVNIDDTGREFIHSIDEPGESFGELPLFDSEPYAATAIANEECLVIRLEKPAFLELLKENNHLHFAFSKLLTRKLRFKLKIISSIATQDPENRIITLLNYLRIEKKNFCTECNQLKLTRQQIADMTGLRVETVIRTIRSMHEKGQLSIEKGKVYYNDNIGNRPGFSPLSLAAFQQPQDLLTRQQQNSQ